MTPRVDIDWIDADDPHEEILRTIREHDLSQPNHVPESYGSGIVVGLEQSRGLHRVTFQPGAGRAAIFGGPDPPGSGSSAPKAAGPHPDRAQ